MEIDVELDLSGLLCPLPVLKARKRLQTMETDQVLKVICTDPAAVIDFPHFCSESGDELLKIEKEEARNLFIIRKG